MYEVYKRPLAESDLKGIWHYSWEEWGELKATEYLLQLDTGIDSLKDNPMIGTSRNYIRAGYRSFHINHHVIYYQLQGQIIDIVRVLHERMNPENHL